VIALGTPSELKDRYSGNAVLLTPDATQAMAAVFGLLAGRGTAVLGASVARPSLDDAFLNETGTTLRDTGVAA
jgi:ABC-2 type transport system ATP-binding protein